MEKEVKEKEKNFVNLDRSKVSKHFVTVLAIVSIVGFIGIISKTLFLKNIDGIVDSLLMIMIGSGLVLESSLSKLISLRHGIDSNNFTNLITIVIGLISIIVGVFSLPFFGIENPSFFAMKGILSVIAIIIIIIIIQTWIVDTFPKS